MTCEDGTVVEVWPGEGFTYDYETSDGTDSSVFLDYDNDYFYTYAFLFLYDLGDSYYYEPENYYEDEIQAMLDDPDSYPNVSATEFTNVEINGYEVWYSVVSFEDDGDTHHELFSFSSLNRENLAISAEIETWSDDEWDMLTGTDGVEAVLNTIYSGVSVVD